jgi:hypothetical protein
MARRRAEGTAPRKSGQLRLSDADHQSRALFVEEGQPGASTHLGDLLAQLMVAL